MRPSQIVPAALFVPQFLVDHCLCFEDEELAIQTRALFAKITDLPNSSGREERRKKKP